MPGKWETPEAETPEQGPWSGLPHGASKGLRLIGHLPPWQSLWDEVVRCGGKDGLGKPRFSLLISPVLPSG